MKYKKRIKANVHAGRDKAVAWLGSALAHKARAWRLPAWKRLMCIRAAAHKKGFIITVVALLFANTLLSIVVPFSRKSRDLVPDMAVAGQVAEKRLRHDMTTLQQLEKTKALEMERRDLVRQLDSIMSGPMNAEDSDKAYKKYQRIVTIEKLLPNE